MEEINVKNADEFFKYGYRILRKTLLGDEIKDYHIGAYGFKTEDAAICDAKRRLKEEIETDAIFTWIIQCYSYENGEERESSEFVVLGQTDKKESTNET